MTLSLHSLKVNYFESGLILNIRHNQNCIITLLLIKLTLKTGSFFFDDIFNKKGG